MINEASKGNLVKAAADAARLIGKIKADTPAKLRGQRRPPNSASGRSMSTASGIEAGAETERNAGLLSGERNTGSAVTPDVPPASIETISLPSEARPGSGTPSTSAASISESSAHNGRASSGDVRLSRSSSGSGTSKTTITTLDTAPSSVHTSSVRAAEAAPGSLEAQISALTKQVEEMGKNFAALQEQHQAALRQNQDVQATIEHLERQTALLEKRTKMAEDMSLQMMDQMQNALTVFFNVWKKGSDAAVQLSR